MKHDYQGVLKPLNTLNEHLLQVAVYNNPAPRCIIILNSDPTFLLESLEPLREYCAKHKLQFPLLVNREFVNTSLDSYPLEFLDIVTADYSNLLAKEDLLKDLRFEASDLRLQIERELKGKWLITRLAVLEQKKKPKLLAETLQMSIRSIMPALKGFCYLANRPIPKNPAEIIAQAGSVAGIDMNLLNSWITAEKADIYIIKNYLEILQGLIRALDRIDND